MIRDNITGILDDISERARSCGRDPGEITLVAVSKTHTASEVDEAIAAGAADLGENRIQEAAAKIPEVGGSAVWHMVGHLQSNKAGDAASLFHWVQSVDRPKIARHLAKNAERLGKTLDILVQVNISGESSKSGVGPEDAERLCEEAASFDSLRLRGLMTIGSLGATPDRTRAEFAGMRALFARLAERFGGETPFDTLSMGMSGDYAIAIEEGSTMLRIGTSIFGERDV